MSRKAIAGLDQGIRLTGVTVGTGLTLPIATAWRLPETGNDLGDLGLDYARRLAALHRDHDLGWVVYESPFLDRYRDKVLPLRKRFGLDMVLESFCRRHGIICCEEPFGIVKRTLAGTPFASKEAMVCTAQQVGIELPATAEDGQEDAADSFAAWLIGVQHYAKDVATRWDQALYSARGRLL